jgi:O-antigen ligase
MAAVVFAAYAFGAGLVAGLAPPLAALAMLLPVFAALLWLIPDQQAIPTPLLRRAFAIMLVAELCVPTYYMAQVSGLPWISLRRLAVLALIAIALPLLSTCRAARKQVSDALGAAPMLFAALVGFGVSAGLSMFCSDDPGYSAQACADAGFNWFLPFFACLVAVGDEREGVALLRLIAALSLPVALLGVADFLAERNFALEIFPVKLLAGMVDSNPGIRLLLEFNPWRNGFFRAVSIYNTPLSFGEFAALCAPLGGFLLLHGAHARDRALGLAVIAGALAALFVSGSRGGSVGFLVAMPLLGALWVVRLWLIRPRGLAGPIAAVVVLMTAGSGLTAVFAWKRLSNIVFGGGDSAGSTASRGEQMEKAWPHILDNPLLGHGFGLGGQVVDWRPSPDAPGSIDSYLVSLLVETGFPGALFYFGALALAACACLRVYLRDRDAKSALAGPLGCSLIAYGLYRLVLSQRENQTLLFVLLALAFIVLRGARERHEAFCQVD